MTKLELLRRKAGMTRIQLSEKSGVSYPTIVKLETCRCGTVTVKAILSLCEALDCNAEELF